MSSLHLRIISYIEKHGPVSYDALELRARDKGIDLYDFDEAITRVHKDRRISVTSKLLYIYKEPKPRNDMTSHLVWLKQNYPKMEEGVNDGSGIDIDYSYLFLSPKELEDYRATIKGTWVQKKTPYSRSLSKP